jgi:tRNA A37 threonylcarbamoyladenosine dehydratase
VSGGSDPVAGAFARLERMVGPEGLARLRAARVAVFGLGAVGSFAVEALARSGVGHLRVVDFDDVRPSNLNRQLYALAGTIGRPKVELAVERVRAINPAIDVDGRRAFFAADTADDLLAMPLDHVIDAIDSLNPKATLLIECVRRGIPVVSSMGAAERSDPTAVRVTDLEETEVCPLARKLRRRLHRAGVRCGITAVWSCEPPVHAPIDADDEGVPGGEETLRRGRDRRTLPSMAPLPGIFGLVAANHVLWAILRGAEAPVAVEGT